MQAIWNKTIYLHVEVSNDELYSTIYNIEYSAWLQYVYVHVCCVEKSYWSPKADHDATTVLVCYKMVFSQSTFIVYNLNYNIILQIPKFQFWDTMHVQYMISIFQNVSMAFSMSFTLVLQSAVPSPLQVLQNIHCRISTAAVSLSTIKCLPCLVILCRMPW